MRTGHMLRLYRKACSIDEFSITPLLQWALGAIVFGYYVAFNGWFYSSLTTVDAYLSGTYSCWPYFQNCEHLLFLRALPFGYSQSLLYMALFGALLSSVYFIYKKDWVRAHMLLIPAFFWHAFVVFLATESLAGNYDYYLFGFSLILLFFPHKEFFLKSALVLFYVLSTVAKIHETWVAGTYFSSLKTGLPLFPDWSIPFFTNLVIFMEMVGAWFLMSRRVIVQRIVLTFFVVFHLYSGLLVGYHYVSIVLPMLLILFGPMYSVTKPPFTRRALVGWIFLALLILFQFVPKFIVGDEKLTMEGAKYGLYMFEANHQCISSIIVRRVDGTKEEHVKESYSARARCAPYRYWFPIHTLCTRDNTVESVEWTFDHSINGGPFYRIVDQPNACLLSYEPLGHNDWIRTEIEAPAVGLPVENYYE